MGLDITAYENVELKAADLEKQVAWELVDNLYGQGIRTISIWDTMAFSERAAPLVVPDNGVNVYVVSGETFEFRAGSHRGHGHFRRWLCTRQELPRRRSSGRTPTSMRRCRFTN